MVVNSQWSPKRRKYNLHIVGLEWRGSNEQNGQVPDFLFVGLWVACSLTQVTANTMCWKLDGIQEWQRSICRIDERLFVIHGTNCSHFSVGRLAWLIPITGHLSQFSENQIWVYRPFKPTGMYIYKQDRSFSLTKNLPVMNFLQTIEVTLVME
jgi:hypothetical protein